MGDVRTRGLSWGVSDDDAQNQAPSNAYVIRAGVVKDRCYIIGTATDKTGPDDELAACMINAMYFPAAMVPLVIGLILEHMHPLALVATLAMVCEGKTRE